MPDATPDSSAEPLRDGRSTRWDQHRRDRRMSIITAAVAAIEQYGPDALTAQIAELAGVPRTHVYRHFDDKQALDLAVTAHIGHQIAHRVRTGLASGRTALEIISAGIDNYLGWVEEHPNLYRFLAQHAYTVGATGQREADDAKAVMAGELTALLGNYLAAFGGDTAPAERIIVGVVGLVDATAVWWLERGEPARVELTGELASQVWLLIERGVRQLGLEINPDQALPAPVARPDGEPAGIPAR